MLMCLKDMKVLVAIGCLVFDNKDILHKDFCDYTLRATSGRYKDIMKDTDTLDTLQSHDQYFEAVLRWREDHPDMTWM